jgi:flagellar biosynthesis/type III secretory pathway protein FliH
MKEINLKLDVPLVGVTLLKQASGAASVVNPKVIPVADSPTGDNRALLAQIATGIEEAHQQTADAVSGLSELAVKFAMVITAKIIGSSEAIEQQRLVQMLNEAINQPETAVAIYVHPNQVSAIEVELAEQLKDGKTLLAPATDLAIGECRVEYASHELVSNLTHQFSQIEIELLDVIGHARL